MGGGGTIVAWGASEGEGGGGEAGFGGFEAVVHPGFLEPLRDDELLTVDQTPMVNPDFFSLWDTSRVEVTWLWYAWRTFSKILAPTRRAGWRLRPELIVIRLQRFSTLPS